MNRLWPVPVIVSCWLLAAHFARSGLPWPTGLAAALPCLLLLRERWVPRLFQLLLVLGAIEWLRTLAVLVTARAAGNEEWTRLALIIGIVAAFTAGSALVFLGRRPRERYAGDHG